MFVNILVSMGMMIVGYMLQSSRSSSSTEMPAESELDDPTVESKPVARVWGSVTIDSPQLIGKWDKQMVKRRADTDKK